MPALLISVRTPEEARFCLTAGVDLLDVKEPTLGSLGQASPEMLHAILDEVASSHPVSAAVGELVDWPEGKVPAEIDRLTFVKWGLARCPADWIPRLAHLRERIESQSACVVVVAAYADYQRAGAPSPDEVCHHAIRTRAGVLLIDTWNKDGTRLSDWLSLPVLTRIVKSCQDAGVRVALGGSLGRRDIPGLMGLTPDWIGVRGAACVGGRRDGPIDPTALADLVALIHPNTFAG